MQTIELERDYRAACQKMLASLDLRTALNRMNEEIGRLHQSLTVEGSQILASPADDEAIKSYRGMVENIVARLDDRDQLRQRDGFKGALQDLLQLGEQLGYARRAEPARVERIVEAIPMPKPVAVVKPIPVHVTAPAPPPGDTPGSFSSVEKELAELQQQLVQLQHS